MIHPTTRYFFKPKSQSVFLSRINPSKKGLANVEMQCRRLGLASSSFRSKNPVLHRVSCPGIIGNRRRIATTTLQSFTDGFLDLALAIPYPEFCPPYATTIILTTAISRLILTLPFSIWVSEHHTTVVLHFLIPVCRPRNVNGGWRNM